MTRFIVVRHGLSEANKAEVFAGLTDAPLLEKGKLQAEYVAQYLAKGERIDRILYSGLTRTRQTAEPSARALGLPLHAEPGLAEIFAGLLADYTPDLVGVQEMDVNFHEPLAYYFEILKRHYGVEYSILLTHHLQRTNDCPIIYRSDRYRVLDQRFVPPRYAPADVETKYPTQYPCGVSSAVFVSRSDPTVRTALLSNHWHWEKEENAPLPPRQQLDAEELAATVLALEAAYPDARVFSTGDFNNHRFGGKYFDAFLSATDGVPADRIAEAHGVHAPGLIHKGCLIDHIVGRRGRFDVLLHRPTHNRSDVLTDHQPIFADVKFL